MTSKATTLILVFIFTVSAFSITLFLKPGDIFSPSPIYTDDYSMHFAQCLSTKRFLSSSGKCWGYDPFFLAGFPRGALVNADNKAWELLFYVLSSFSEGFAFKIYLLLLLIIYPFLLYGAARNCNLSRGVSVIASVLSLFFFHLSIAIDFVSWGMVSYVFVCFFAIYLFSLLYKLFEQFTWKRYCIFVVLSSLMLLMHILSPLILFVPLLILYACNMRTLTFSRHIALLLMALIVLVLNSFWLIPLVQFFQDKTARPENYSFTLQIDNLLEPVTVYFQQKQSILHRKAPQLNNTFIEVILLLFGIGGLYSLGKERKMKLMLALAGGTLFLFAIAYYGSHTTLFPQLQPQRFTIPLNIFLIIPASISMFLMFQMLFTGRNKRTVCFSAVLMFVLLVGPVGKPLKAIYSYNLYRLNCEFPPPLRELLNCLETTTSREGRILLEDSEFSKETPQHEYYGGHFPALFPEQVKREYLCAPRPLYPIKHSYASFTTGVLFEKKIEDYSLQELKERVEIYNVKWIVCWLEQSKKVFNRYPDYLVKKAEIDTFTIYEVNKNPSFFLKGEGVVKSDYNRLALSQLAAADDEVIISYHWMKGLQSNPARKLERVFVGNDPIGFIRIIDPPHSLVISNKY
jgi:hypothetical protein